MSDSQTINFSSFVSGLLSDLMESIITSHVEQEQKIRELSRYVEMSDEELIEFFDLDTIAKDSLLKPDSKISLEEKLEELIKEKRAAILQFAEKGIPKVFVERGEISAKVAFFTEDSITTDMEDEDKSKTTKTKKRPDEIAKIGSAISTERARTLGTKGIDLKSIINVVSSTSVKDSLNKSRIKILPVNNENVDLSNSNTQLSSTINIQFRTIYS